jgi:hypothetical protein
MQEEFVVHVTDEETEAEHLSHIRKVVQLLGDWDEIQIQGGS